MTHKNSYKRGESPVPTHFTKKRVEHKEGCKYNTAGQVTEIAKVSDDKILESIKR